MQEACPYKIKVSTSQVMKKKAMVATQDDSDEESSDEEDSQKESNLALMAIGDDDELDEVNNLSTYDKLYDASKELYNDWIRVGKKSAYLKKKMQELINEKDALQKYNDSLNEKIKGLELDKQMLHDKIAKGKQSISYDHEESHVDDLKNENEILKKKSNELNEIVLKFTNG